MRHRLHPIRFLLTAGLLPCLVAASLPPAQAAVVFAENFATAVGDPRLFPYGEGFGLGNDILGTQFRVTRGNIDVLGQPSGAPVGCANPAGNCIDLQGFSGSAMGAIESKPSFDILAGYTYTITFGAGVGDVGTGRSDFDVLLGSFSSTVAAGINHALFTLTWTAQANESGARLGFSTRSVATVANGAVLDNILVTAVAPTTGDPGNTVPEPASLALLVASLAAAGAACRRAGAQS